MTHTHGEITLAGHLFVKTRVILSGHGTHTIFRHEIDRLRHQVWIMNDDGSGSISRKAFAGKKSKERARIRIQTFTRGFL